MTLVWRGISDDVVTLQVAFTANGDLYAVMAVVGQVPARYAILAISDKDFHAVKGIQSLALARRIAEEHARRKGIK